MNDGHLGKCKRCCKLYAKKRRVDYPKQAKATDKRKHDKRKRDPKRYKKWREQLRINNKNNKERNTQLKRIWAQNNLQKVKTTRKNWLKENPEKRKAQQVVGSHIKNGTIPKASSLQCTDCINPAKHYHHESYLEEHWLDIVPLCTACHGIRHRKYQ